MGMCLGEMGALLRLPDEVEFTGNGAEARSCEPPPCFRNPKVWSKAIAVKSKNTTIGWIFKELLGPTTLGATEGKVQILPPRSRIQLPMQGVSPQDPRTFQTDLGSLDLTGSLLQRKHDGTDVWLLVCLSL